MSMTLDGLTLPPNMPVDITPDLEQEAFVSTSNRVYTYESKGAAMRTIRVQVSGMSGTEKDNVDNHYRNTAKGARNAFNVTLHDGSVYNGVHYWRKPQFREGANSLWSVTFTFLQPSV